MQGHGADAGAVAHHDGRVWPQPCQPGCLGGAEAGHHGAKRRKIFQHGGKDYLPIRVGQIDFDREKLLKELALRSKSLEGLEHEEDITITTDGTIWQTIGTKNHVHLVFLPQSPGKRDLLQLQCG